MIAGLVLLAAARRALASLERARSTVFGLELARDASEREDSPIVVVAPSIDPDSELETEPRRTPLALRALAAAAVVTVLALFASFFAGAPAPTKQRWTFLDDSFATGDAWSIEHHEAATGGRALSKDAGGSSAVLVATSTPARDVRAMTRCKAQGEGCGLAFRVADDRTFTVARVAGNRVELVRVDDGKEHVLGSKTIASGAAGVWQELAVEARGDSVRVAVNGAHTLDVHDPRPAVAGGVGLWAPARAWFDELSIETLSTSPQAIEVLPFLRRAS
jgi:hypothetical protein